MSRRAGSTLAGALVPFASAYPMGVFKILSDFDGVWTEVDREAEAVLAHLVERCATLSGRGPAEVREDFAAARRAIAADPSRFGWSPDGRVAAFCDEDPLCWIAGVCQWIDEADHDTARSYRAAIEAGGTSVREFSELGFVGAMRRFRREQEPAIHKDARAQLQAVRDTGAQVVVCSNSEPSKLIEWFGAVGIGAGTDDRHELRIRGSACKHLVAGDASVTVGGRRVLVDRPHYREAIEAESPSLVIGDIFSLDLSVPHVMRQAGHPAAPRALALRRHPHTPDWILEGHRQGVVDHLVERFVDLAQLLPHAVEA